MFSIVNGISLYDDHAFSWDHTFSYYFAQAPLVCSLLLVLVAKLTVVTLAITYFFSVFVTKTLPCAAPGPCKCYHVQKTV